MKSIKLQNYARIINIISAATFTLVSLWLLAIDGADFVTKIESLSIFLPTSEFMADLLKVPGGLLTALSLFTTQSFYYPWLGALVYTVLLLGIAATAVKAFRLSWAAFPAMLLLPAMILLALLNMEYLIFSMKTPGYAFLLPFGTLIGLALTWTYRKIRLWPARLVAIILTAVLGYAVMGFYGLLTTGMFIAIELSNAIGNKEARWKSLTNIVIGIVCIALVPKIWFTQIGGRAIMEEIYTYQLPRFYEGEESHWRPYYIVFASMLLLSLTSTIPFIKSIFANRRNIATALSILVGILSVAGIFNFRYTDSNFKLTLAIDRALQDGEWHKASEYAKEVQEAPTRLVVFLTHIAQIRTGEAAENIFRYKISSAEPNTERALRATHDVGSMMLSYHLGMTNYAYRWAMENKVEYGLSVEYLKFLIKCSLMNKEYKLAEKYLDNLSLTAFHKDWAEKYRKYIDNPKLMNSDPEMSQILPIQIKENMFISDHGQLEGYLWPFIAKKPATTPQQVELSMISALVCRDLNSFAAKVPQYMSTHKGRIPTHFQEAIMMWLISHEVTDYKKFEIDDEIIDRCQQFMQMTKQYANLSDEALKEIAEPQFGDTYWYYFVLNTGFTII